jgi:glycosyltransferase involved in cell wall biosynthesis
MFIGFGMSEKKPLFSIVTPAWNRETCIEKCINSVLSQRFEDFEHIIVDDCSTDKTVEIIQSIHDNRIKLIQHEHNRGVCPARGTGTKHAKADWLIYLDSDWTLKPDALLVFCDCIRGVSDRVGIIGARIQIDNGEIWPIIIPQGEIGYIDWLKWKQKCIQSGGSDYLSCRRKEAVNSYPWPEVNVYEIQIEFRILQKWEAFFIDAVLGIEYLTTDNSISRTRTFRSLMNRKKVARFHSQNNCECIEVFGSDLKEFAPGLYAATLFSAIYWSLLAKDRHKSLKLALQYFKQIKFDTNIFFIVLCGLIQRNILLLITYVRGLLKSKAKRRGIAGIITKNP